MTFCTSLCQLFENGSRLRLTGWNVLVLKQIPFLVRVILTNDYSILFCHSNWAGGFPVAHCESLLLGQAQCYSLSWADFQHFKLPAQLISFAYRVVLVKFFVSCKLEIAAPSSPLLSLCQSTATSLNLQFISIWFASQHLNYLYKNYFVMQNSFRSFGRIFFRWPYFFRSTTTTTINNNKNLLISVCRQFRWNSYQFFGAIFNLKNYFSYFSRGLVLWLSP